MHCHRSRMFFWLLGIISIVLPRTAWGVEARVLSESSDGHELHLRIDVPTPVRSELEIDGVPFAHFDFPGYAAEGESGTPIDVVGSQLVGVPPGGSASLRLVRVETRDLSGIRLAPVPRRYVAYRAGEDANDPAQGMPAEDLVYDPAVYHAAEPVVRAATLGAAGRLRHQDVVTVQVHPLLYDPKTLRLQIVTALEVAVSLQPGPSKSRQALVRAQQLGSPVFDRIYSGALVNATRASQWLYAPSPVARHGVALKNGLLRPGLLGEPEWKIRVRHTGLTRIAAADLLASGFPDGTPVDRLRMVLKRFNPDQPLDPAILEIAVHLEDNDSDGLFRSGDALVFYAEMPRDDATAGERAQRYSFDNVYWLSISQSGTPARMEIRAPVASTTPAPSVFLQTLTFEEERVTNTFVFDEDDELYFMSRPVSTEAVHTFALLGRAPGADVEICVATQQDTDRRAYTAYADIGGNRIALGSDPGTRFHSRDAPPEVTVCGTVGSADVTSENLSVVLVPDPVVGQEGLPVTPFLDRFWVNYEANYTATADAITFNNAGATGNVEFNISGFSGAALYAFDRSDPKSPALFDLTGALNGGILTLTDQVTVGLRQYEVLPVASLASVDASNIELDVTDNYLDELATAGLGTYDALVIAYDDFADEPSLQDWIAFRSSQGHRIRLLKTSNAYDAFTGGLLHFDAIFRAVQLAYQNWGIDFVLLIGDGSEDAAGLGGNGQNFLPARMIYTTVSGSSGGGSQHRNDMHERYYAEMDPPAPDQFGNLVPDKYADLMLGRWSVGTRQELRNVIEKTIRYETPEPGDDGEWRKRIVLFADDEWLIRRPSGSTANVHRRGGAEPGFERGIMEACDIVNNAFPGDFECVPYLLRTISDQLFDLGVAAHVPWDPARGSPNTAEYRAEHLLAGEVLSFYFDEARQAFVDSVAGGALFVVFQAHANRSQVTDERVIGVGSGRFFEPALNNPGKPIIWFGLGCHANEYGDFGEDPAPGITNDALGELLLHEAESGAVASYASTGFEFLSANRRLNNRMFDSIFNKAFTRVRDGVEASGDTIELKWQLGELIAIGEATDNNAEAMDRYCILGDPMLRIDAGFARFSVDAITNGFIRPGNRLGVRDPKLPVGLEVTVNDEQGIDSLYVVKRFQDGRPTEVIENVTITANIDEDPRIVAKRSYTLSFDFSFADCDFEIVVGARSRSGRTHEFVGRGFFDQRLVANGLQVRNGDLVDARTAFQLEINGCAPQETLPLMLFVDDVEVPAELMTDSLRIDWLAEFVLDLAPGEHTVRALYEGNEILNVTAIVAGELGIANIIAFPNPFEDFTRVYFTLARPIDRGFLRIMDLNGRTVRRFDLTQPGVLQSDNSGFGTGSSRGWNYVEWDGTDRAGDFVANGVYLYELRIEDSTGKALRKRDKIVVMQ